MASQNEWDSILALVLHRQEEVKTSMIQIGKGFRLKEWQK